MATTRALFGGYNSSDHINIWVTNGTARGTTELTVAGGGVVSAGGVQALDITVLRGEGFFSGKNADNEYDLWVTNGTSTGTSELTVSGAYYAGLYPPVT